MKVVEADGPSTRERIAKHVGVMTAGELSDILHMSKQTIFRLAKKGVIPRMQVGGSVRFCPIKVAEWLDNQ